MKKIISLLKAKPMLKAEDLRPLLLKHVVVYKDIDAVFICNFRCRALHHIAQNSGKYMCMEDVQLNILLLRLSLVGTHKSGVEVWIGEGGLSDLPLVFCLCHDLSSSMLAGSFGHATATVLLLSQVCRQPEERILGEFSPGENMSNEHKVIVLPIRFPEESNKLAHNFFSVKRSTFLMEPGDTLLDNLRGEGIEALDFLVLEKEATALVVAISV
jgi:hypothetical protein